jgi:hypothetical protein
VSPNDIRQPKHVYCEVLRPIGLGCNTKVRVYQGDEDIVAEVTVYVASSSLNFVLPFFIIANMSIITDIHIAERNKFVKLTNK